MPVQAKGAVFGAEIVPTSGGATGFADMSAAYERLDDELRLTTGGRTARHSRRRSMERAGLAVTDEQARASVLYGFGDVEPPTRPLVEIHPETGRPNLLAGQHTFDVSGLTNDESGTLLRRLTETSTDGVSYHHEWRVGDVLIWDNGRLMHRATAHDPTEPRRLRHTRIAGDPTSESALNYPAC